MPWRVTTHVNGILGARRYHFFLDGVEVGTKTDTTFVYRITTPGVHTLACSVEGDDGTSARSPNTTVTLAGRIPAVPVAPIVTDTTFSPVGGGGDGGDGEG